MRTYPSVECLAHLNDAPFAATGNAHGRYHNRCAAVTMVAQWCQHEEVWGAAPESEAR
ncbi:hypothetical protein HMPREF9592_01471 [Cutibacterium acnes HL046PA1]|nr:hypothetical protein HMPREF9612_01257 [Cutibacterium acnes HL063PA2]EFT73771.1 hypothetical protein HMPREF9592_01471 [Cutibacterium acnes HL046PA1]